VQLGDRSFTVARPRLCNKLPGHLSVHKVLNALSCSTVSCSRTCLLTTTATGLTVACTALYRCTYLLTYLLLLSSNVITVKWNESAVV